MLHFIVDGYNLINKIEEVKKFSLKEKRSYLIWLLEDFKSRISPKNRITLVFDGREDVYFLEAPRTNLRILFSQGEDADSLIKKIVKNSKNPQSLVIVTDDKSIISYARSYGAKCRRNFDFLRELKRKRERETETLEDNFKISPLLAYKINQELERIWKEKY